MSHFIEVCKFCGTVIAQCRCFSCIRTKKLGVCNKCKESGADSQNTQLPQSSIDRRVEQRQDKSL
jgi:ribosome-binding protein aMBF1 (putative translation factor)